MFKLLTHQWFSALKGTGALNLTSFSVNATDLFLFMFSVHLFLSVTVQLKKMYETPLVQLRPEGEWSADIDALVVYTELRPFPSSSWDWIGLYRVSSTSL